MNQRSTVPEFILETLRTDQHQEIGTRSNLDLEQVEVELEQLSQELIILAEQLDDILVGMAKLVQSVQVQG